MFCSWFLILPSQFPLESPVSRWVYDSISAPQSLPANVTSSLWSVYSVPKVLTEVRSVPWFPWFSIRDRQYFTGLELCNYLFRLTQACLTPVWTIWLFHLQNRSVLPLSKGKSGKSGRFEKEGSKVKLTVQMRKKWNYGSSWDHSNTTITSGVCYGKRGREGKTLLVWSQAAGKIHAVLACRPVSFKCAAQLWFSLWLEHSICFLVVTSFRTVSFPGLHILDSYLFNNYCFTFEIL